jgi:hypothetical protein
VDYVPPSVHDLLLQHMNNCSHVDAFIASASAIVTSAI